MQMAKPAMQCGLDIELHTLNFVAHRPECTLDLYNVEKPSPKALWCNLSLQPLLCDVDIRRPGLKTRPVSLYGLPLSQMQGVNCSWSILQIAMKRPTPLLARAPQFHHQSSPFGLRGLPSGPRSAAPHMTLNLRLTESIKGIASTFSCLQLPPLCVLGAQRRTRFYLYIYTLYIL